eukprot:CAMPEP_0181170484 /NCGR_PEP_ID=MMETSP1096-20121128/1390_1 /TAXON_ID=156174 ORGANISM="Chrysochromulina ericina, Strain CCMP281" /NCGR_SAMPLE_ID=MMETSP1096 /ASSEMBLY_ACC=CAM_ASM_000453 /LENGTH=51 /DNA_ID=CAMNT_0023258047 /DNA_START=164 /DNA_END=319 /DNA_ORIENTATION=-
MQLAAELCMTTSTRVMTRARLEPVSGCTNDLCSPATTSSCEHDATFHAALK